MASSSGKFAALNPTKFWTLLGTRPVSVPVVAARDDNGPAGLLALSATHVAADPPSMLVAVSKATSALSTIKKSGCFAINYLPDDASETAEIFGGRRGIAGAARFERDKWGKLSTGAPVFCRAPLVLDCKVDRIYEYYDTDIVIGQIVASAMNRELRPLVVRSGQYVGWPS